MDSVEFALNPGFPMRSVALEPRDLENLVGNYNQATAV